MTLAELTRYMESYKRRQKAQEQQQATFDYIHADLVGRSIARIYSSTAQMPQIYDVYSSLFDKEAIENQQSEKQAELSAIRFKKFAQAYTKKYNRGVRDV